MATFVAKNSGGVKKKPIMILGEDVSIHRINLKYCGKSPKIRFLPYFRIL